MLKSLIHVLSIILLFSCFNNVFATTQLKIKINTKSFYNKQMIVSSKDVSLKTKKYINLLVEEKIKSDKQLLSIYNRIKNAQNKIKGNQSKKYQKISKVLNYFEAKLGLEIHADDNIIKILPPEIISATLQLGEYYLVEGNGVKAILKLNGFSRSGYIDNNFAPTMSIYSEYEDGKYFNILSTFIIPDGKGSNTGEDLFRSNIDKIIFDYKLDSFILNKSIVLKLRTKGDAELKVSNINILDDKYTLVTRDDLNTGNIINAYSQITTKVKTGLKK